MVSRQWCFGIGTVSKNLDLFCIVQVALLLTCFSDSLESEITMVPLSGGGTSSNLMGLASCNPAGGHPLLGLLTLLVQNMLFQGVIQLTTLAASWKHL